MVGIQSGSIALTYVSNQHPDLVHTIPCGFYTGLSSCSICPTNAPIASTPTTCTACPPRLLCPFGSNASISVTSRFGLSSNDPSTWQNAITSPTPLDSVRDQSQSRFVTWQLVLGSFIAICAAIGVVLVVYVLRSNIQDYVLFGWSLTNLDFFFRVAHSTPAGQPIAMTKSCLGSVLTIITAFLVFLAGILLVLLNTFVISPATTVTTSSLPFEPQGLFQVQVLVAGVGLDKVCIFGQIALNLADPATVEGAPDAISTITYIPFENLCEVTWLCKSCRLRQMPVFKLATVTADAWASFYFVNVTLPVPVTADGTLFTLNPIPATISQLIFPTNNPSDRVAFRRSFSEQSISLLLTGNTITDNRPTGADAVYASYQPSIISVNKAVTSNSDRPSFMTDQWPVTLTSNQQPGFRLTIGFQRNTILVIKLRCLSY